MSWRVYTTWQSSQTRDWSHLIVTTALQSHLELWLGIMAANLPMMGSLLRKCAGPISSTYTKLSTGAYLPWATNGSRSIGDNSKQPAASRKKFERIGGESEESMAVPLGNIINTRTYDVETGFIDEPLRGDGKYTGSFSQASGGLR